MWRCHQILSEFLAKGHLLRVSHQSHLSSNDMGDEMIPQAVYWYPDIYLTVEENPGKRQLGDCLMKTVRPVIVSNGVLTSN